MQGARDGTSTAVLLPDLDATICLLQLTNDVQRTARCIARTETKCRSNGRTTCLRAWLVAYEGRSTTGWLEGPWLRDKRNRHLRQWNPSNNPPYTHKGIFSRSGFEEDKTSVAKTAVEKPAVQIQHPILAVVGSYAEGPSISFAAQIHSPRSSSNHPHDVPFTSIVDIGADGRWCKDRCRIAEARLQPWSIINQPPPITHRETRERFDLFLWLLFFEYIRHERLFLSSLQRSTLELLARPARWRR